MVKLMQQLLVFFLCFVQFHTGLSFLLDTETSDSRCPLNLSRDRYLHVYRDKCYQFVLWKEKYWSDARRDCQSKGGDLVVVGDALDQNFMMGTLTKLGVGSKRGIWIGLTDIHHELHWMWVNGEPLTGYNNWAKNQGGANILHLTQDCAQIRLNDRGLWHDRECHLWPNRYSYICQYELLPIKSTSSKVSTTPTTKITSEASQTTTEESTSSSPPFSPSDHSSLESLNITTPVPVKSTTSIEQSVVRLSTITTSSILSALITQPAERSSSVTTSVKIGTHVSRKSTSYASVSADSQTPHSMLLSTSSSSSNYTSSSSSPYSFSPSSSPVASSSSTSSTKRAVICSEINCQRSCPNGYGGVFVGIDGCITCKCN